MMQGLPKTDISGTQIVLNERVDEEGYISDQNQSVKISPGKESFSWSNQNTLSLQTLLVTKIEF